ncbi:MAG TPA: pilus assembly protein PilS, partial [Phycisphaerales bacterium]|nr:pilus assembly protein PilS [Phycisphaerales bacterium]
MHRKLFNQIKDWLSKIIVQQEDVVGVDIMPGYIRIAELDQQKNNWTLTRVGYRYVEGQIETDDLEENPDNYADKLQQVLRTNKITTTNAAISIPVSSAIIRVISVPMMTEEELQEAVRTDSLWENVVQLPDALDEYSIFHQVITRHSKENMMDILFVASKLNDIELYMRIVRQAGLNPVVVDVRCFSLRNALDLKKNISSKQPLALLEFGPFENYLLILYQDSPFIAEIYISEQDKEKYLLLSSSSATEVESSKIFERYSLQVSQVISTYQAKYKVEIKKIFVTSTLPSISNAVDQLQHNLSGIAVDVFNPISDIRVPENIAKKITAEPNISMFAPVLGLATRKL